MKIFFDSNVYVAEALRGRAAVRLIRATQRAKWRIFASPYLVDEVAHVLVDYLHFSKRLAVLTRMRIIRRAVLIEGHSKARVPQDPKDSPILKAALACGADFLVSNDRHLLSLDPFESLRIISMNDYYQLLSDRGWLK